MNRKQPTTSEYRQLTSQLLNVIAAKESEKFNRPVVETHNATISTFSVNKGTTIIPPSTTSQHTTRQSTALAASSAAAAAAVTASKKNTKGKKEKEYAEEWVQCDLCSRWRLLPAPFDPLYPKELPDKWICTMNTWNTSQALCRLVKY